MKHNFFKKETDFVEKSLREGKKNFSLKGLYGSAKALFLIQLKENCDRPVLVITRDQTGAEELLHDLSFFSKWSACQNSPFLFFPSWDLLPYEYLSPQKEIVGERMKTLLELSQRKSSLVVTSLEPCLQLLIPQEELKRSILKFDLKDIIDLEIVRNCLVSSGYEHVEIVEDRGEFSVRGGIIDLFPSNHSDPFRIELFGDEIESLRRFDVDSQVSVESVHSLIVMPVIEQILNKELFSKGIQKINAEAESSKFPQKIIHETINRLENIYPFSGVELLNPYFYSNMDSLFDYLDKDYLIVLDEPELIENKRRKFEELVYEEYDKAIARGEFIPSPEKIFLNKEQFYTQINKRNRLEMQSLSISENTNETESTASSKQIPSFKDRIKDFIEQIKSWQKEGNRVVITVSSESKATRFKELLLGYDLVLEVVVGDLSNGINLTESKTIFVSEHEVFGQQQKKKYKLTTGKQIFYRGLKDLKEGDFVVHIDYGIGLYQGEKDLEIEGGAGEFLELLYADDEKLYLPVENLNLIQKYSGAGQENLSLDKISGVKWKKQKEKVKKSIKEMAEDLLKLYAAREIVEGHAYQEDSDLHRQFADAFEFVETVDQLKAVEEVSADMEKEKPMDRLICGDVGYGKTEVAMRAALKAASDSKQVAFLVPTTILAQQHFNTFNKRFEGYPVKIDMLNRFRPPKTQKEIIKKVESGEVDILIGTHRILQKDIKFKDLGLIVIDEEQRFGVKHKEKLKKLRKKVDILTLTATPIPRTLHFSLMGVRDLSVIETPPKDRLAIKTYIHKFNEAAICQGIKKEVERGGQVFFVHNWVATIGSMADYIKRIVPGINVDFAHGQMREHNLEKVMMKFINKEIDVLICTTIIEAGLDIPSANTIIINRADRFGLAQLYQLRGRVGRDCHQAYAYLLVPDDILLSDLTRRRLRAIEELSDLGSGFQLASRDMEIRGSGNYLGHQQSGHISAVGFDLYCKLMEETVREIKGEIPEQDFEPEINLHIKGFIPKDYIPNLNQRLEFYRRLYMTYDQENTGKILNELEDRYGPPPEPLKKLIAVLEIKFLCHQLKINDISLTNGKVKIKVMNETPISIESVMSSIEKGTHRISFLNDNSFQMEIAGKNWNEICVEIKRNLKQLSVSDQNQFA